MDSEQKEIEYLKLWMEQSKLFWSRLQIAITIHSGGLVGWYYLYGKNVLLGSIWLLIVVTLSFCLRQIMCRDSELKKCFALKTGFFNEYHKDRPENEKNVGTNIAISALNLLMFVEVLLIIFWPIRPIMGYWWVLHGLNH